MKIKILTLNIWGGELLDRVINFIRKEDPDIALLQEVNNGMDSLNSKFKSIDILRKELGFPYCSFEPLFLDIRSGNKIPQGNAIFSRFPIGNQKAIFFDIPFGEFNLEEIKSNLGKNQFLSMGMLKTDVNVNSRNINSYSVHGIWGFDGEDSARRLKMSKIIVEEIKNRKDVILAGDFNLKPSTKTIKNIEGYLQNVFGKELIRTFNMKHKKLPGYATAAVDMIFVSKHFKVINHYMPNVDVSDHMPLVCEIEI